jgi:hypothetical protein
VIEWLRPLATPHRQVGTLWTSAITYTTEDIGCFGRDWNGKGVDRPGHLSDQGTPFLDEVGDRALQAQSPRSPERRLSRIAFSPCKDLHGCRQGVCRFQRSR